MITKQFERTLLHQDDAALKEVIADLSQFKPYLDKLVEAYNKFDLADAPFDYGVFEFIKNGDIQQITNQYFKKVNDSMTETGLLYDRLRNMLLEDAQAPVQEFRNAYQALKSFTPVIPAARSVMHQQRSVSLSLDEITFDNDLKSFVVSSVDQNKILEANFRAYIDSQDEQDLYNVLSTLRVSLLNYYAAIKNLKVPPNITQGFTPNTFLEDFFQFEIGVAKADIKPQAIKWATSFKNR